MSGHSKWNNIKRKKEKTDGARAKVFTKIGREISVAVKEGGGNPASNSKLAALIAKAKANSVPNDNIQRIIKRAEGGDKTEYEAITYEGYGPGGIAVMVETLTDNRNRTAANMRHYFDKFGGNLGQMGCVGFMFTQKGVIVVDLEDKDPDELMMDALDAGAEDFDAGEEAAQITTDPDNFTAVCEALEKKGYTFISADVAQVPSTTTTLTDPDQLTNMGKLLDALDEDALKRILTEPKNSIVKQYEKLFELDDVELSFEAEALDAIAKKAMERKTGARGLRAIMEGAMLDLMYTIPSDDSIESCVVTKDVIDGTGEPLVTRREPRTRNRRAI